MYDSFFEIFAMSVLPLLRISSDFFKDKVSIFSLC